MAKAKNTDSPNAMARAIIVEVAARLYGGEDPAITDLAEKVQQRIPDGMAREDALAISVAALMQMLAFPAPGAEEGLDRRWFDDPAAGAR